MALSSCSLWWHWTSAKVRCLQGDFLLLQSKGVEATEVNWAAIQSRGKNPWRPMMLGLHSWGVAGRAVKVSKGKWKQDHRAYMTTTAIISADLTAASSCEILCLTSSRACQTDRNRSRCCLGLNKRVLRCQSEGEDMEKWGLSRGVEEVMQE